MWRDGETHKLIRGDCLTVLHTLADASVDMVCADPPYGTTACEWDSIIPLEPMWAELKRVIKPRGGIVMTASQPFTTTLIVSNREWFKYCWVWDKVQPTGFPNANVKPLVRHEDVCIFYELKPTYNPQMSHGNPSRKRTQGGKTAEVYNGFAHIARASGHERFPVSIITASKGHSPNNRSLHPTQKPVALMDYLIRTYTNEGDTVLDFCMGSGTTGVACKRIGRKFIGIELDPNYFEIAKRRIDGARFGTRPIKRSKGALTDGPFSGK